MSEFFGFDPKKYSDEELLERAGEINRRVSWAYRMGNQAIVQQLQGQRALIEMEQRERLFRNSVGTRMVNLPPVVIETDPDLAAAHKAERDAEMARTNPQPKSHRKPMDTRRDNRIRSSQPAPEKDDND